MNKRQLVVMVGPTAVGKTALSVEIAKQIGTEIVSCDSRQFYRELSVGTAKPTPAELQSIKHHFIDSHSISAYYSAGDYERDALLLLDKLFEKYQTVILTGGSGLFVKAITHGLDELPEPDLTLRAALMQRLEAEGVDGLAEELRTLDPVYYETADMKNAQRVVRALEVSRQTGRPFSEFHQRKVAERPFNLIKIGLERPREILYERINQRVDQMLTDGLLEEVERVRGFRQHNALQTVGYKEVMAYFDGEISYETMVELIKRNTRRYAKRQLTWFKNQDTFTWFQPDQQNEILTFINSAPH